MYTVTAFGINLALAYTHTSVAVWLRSRLVVAIGLDQRSYSMPGPAQLLLGWVLSIE